MAASAPASNDQRFREIVEQIFNRWSALKICVEHGMGGRNSHQVSRRQQRTTMKYPTKIISARTQTAIDIMNYTFEYCTKNEACTVYEIQELLDDAMDEEFETICDDNSTQEIATCLVRYLTLLREQNLTAIAAELAQLPACTQWLTPAFKVQYAPRAADDSSSDDDDDDSGDDDEMDDDDTPAEQPASRRQTRSSAAKNNGTSSSGAGGDMETEEDDGWTKVPSRRRH